MNSESFQIITRNEIQTRRFGEMIGRIAEPGLIIGLIGDLGAGKTCFVKGLADGLGVDSERCVASPTFTLINEYEGRIPLFHADLYRLSGIEDLEDVGFFDLMGADGIIAVEWADKLTDSVLGDHLRIHFGESDQADQWAYRKITVTGGGAVSKKFCARIREAVQLSEFHCDSFNSDFSPGV